MKRGAVLMSFVLIGVMATLPEMRAQASGFQLQEQTASGLGIAFSGMPAAAADAGVAFWNPAAMSLLPGTQAAAAASYIKTSFEFASAGPPPGGSSYNAFGNGGNAGSGTWVPALYGKVSITPQLSAGLAINAPFGLSTEWHSPWAGMFHAVKSEVKSLNINPSISYKFGDYVSLGGGLSYQRLEATLSNGLTPLIPTAQGSVQGSDWEYGYNLGALVEFGEGTRLGLSYRSAIKYTILGSLTFNNAAFAPLASTIQADLELPQTFAVGISHAFSPAVRALADITWTGWDSVQSLTVIATSGPATGHPISNVALNFRKSWRAGAGIEYQLNPTWLLRGGVAFDRSPVQDEFRTPRLPDNDRKWLATGVRFQPNTNWSIDVGYAHLWVKSSPSELAPAGPVPGALLGQYDAKTDIFATQVSVHF
jgi:long-chain fatty acid transport protein